MPRKKQPSPPEPCRDPWHSDPFHRGQCPSWCGDEDLRSVFDKACHDLYWSVDDSFRGQFERDLCAEHGFSAESKAVQAALSAAWEEGHSSGYAEVANVFPKYAEIVKLALAERK